MNIWRRLAVLVLLPLGVACVVSMAASSLTCRPYERIWLSVQGLGLGFTAAYFVISKINEVSTGAALLRAGLLQVVLLLLGDVFVANTCGAIGRGSQKRTMADIRAYAAAIESYVVEHKQYPVADGVDAFIKLGIKVGSGKDGWGNPLRIKSDLSGYTIASPAECGCWETDPLTESRTAKTTDFTADIIFKNGRFVRYPEGV